VWGGRASAEQQWAYKSHVALTIRSGGWGAGLTGGKLRQPDRDWPAQRRTETLKRKGEP